MVLSERCLLVWWNLQVRSFIYCIYSDVCGWLKVYTHIFPLPIHYLPPLGSSIFSSMNVMSKTDFCPRLFFSVQHFFLCSICLSSWCFLPVGPECRSCSRMMSHLSNATLIKPADTSCGRIYFSSSCKQNNKAIQNLLVSTSKNLL